MVTLNRGKTNLSIRDLSKELESSAVRYNRIVERFLFNQVTDKELDCGIGCAGDIERFMKREGIETPDGKTRLKWLNRQIWDCCRNGTEHFKIIEIEGTLKGINFAWWYVNGVNKPEIQNIPDDNRIGSDCDHSNPNVC